MVNSPIVVPNQIGSISRSFSLGTSSFDIDNLYSPGNVFSDSLVLDLASPKYVPNKKYIFCRSGNDNNGTITGAVWIQLPSGIWYLAFDGTDDRVNIIHASSLNAVLVITYIVWVRPTITWQDTTGFHQIFDKRSDAGGIVPTFLYSDTSNTLAMFSGTTCATGTKASFAAGTWFMVAGMAVDGVVGGAGNKVWINGMDDTSATDTATFATNTDDLVIGASFADPGYSNFLKGGVALGRQFSRSFTDAEIFSIFNRERHLFGV